MRGGSGCAPKLRGYVDELLAAIVWHQLLQVLQLCGRVVLWAEVKKPAGKPVTEPGQAKEWLPRNQQPRRAKEVHELGQRLVVNETAEHDAAARICGYEIEAMQDVMAFCVRAEDGLQRHDRDKGPPATAVETKDAIGLLRTGHSCLLAIRCCVRPTRYPAFVAA